MVSERCVTAWRVTLLVFLTFIIIFLVGMSIFLLAQTSGNIWIVYALSSGLALLSGVGTWRLWRFLTGMSSFMPNYIASTIFITLLLSTGALTINYFAARTGAMQRTAGIITRIYGEKRYRMKRISRLTYTRGEPYQVYIIETRFDSGCTEDFEVHRDTYNQAQRGDTATVLMGRGRLGLAITDKSTFQLLHPRHSQPKRHCKFVGTSGGSKGTPPRAVGTTDF